MPLGLGQDAAVAMAKSMASFIVARFDVPVSIGVHGDNAVDLDGQAKDASLVGFHAHLYFPTRSIRKDGEGASVVWYFGDKLRELGNRNSSADIVDGLNEKWCALANRFATSAGIDAKCEWKSYNRLGLDITPGPVRGRRFGKDNNWTKPGRL